MGSHWEKYETDEASGNKIKVHIMELHILKKIFSELTKDFIGIFFIKKNIFL